MLIHVIGNTSGSCSEKRRVGGMMGMFSCSRMWPVSAVYQNVLKEIVKPFGRKK